MSSCNHDHITFVLPIYIIPLITKNVYGYFSKSHSDQFCVGTVMYQLSETIILPWSRSFSQSSTIMLSQVRKLLILASINFILPNITSISCGLANFLAVLVGFSGLYMIELVVVLEKEPFTDPRQFNIIGENVFYCFSL